MNVLTSNEKLEKCATYGWRARGVQMASGDSSGREVCPNRTPLCSAVCVMYAGMGNVPSVHRARVARTKLFFTDRKGFKAQLIREIGAHEYMAHVRQGLGCAVRLNTFSDLAYERIMPDLFETFPSVQFYDYTKSEQRMGDYVLGNFPPNYHLTFSLSENNAEFAIRMLRAGGNVAVPFSTGKGQQLPRHHAIVSDWASQSAPVVDGDEHDLTFLHKSTREDLGLIVGLRAKGKARTSGGKFVQAVQR